MQEIKNEIRNDIDKGDKVRWKSQAMGIEKEKIGVVLRVIPRGVNAMQFIPFGAKKAISSLIRPYPETTGPLWPWRQERTGILGITTRQG